MFSIPPGFFIIPGKIIALLTFPGVILHEWTHKLFCELVGVPVYEVKYFQFDEDIAGYVSHGEPKSFRQSFFIAFGPFFLNSFVAIGLGIIAEAISAAAPKLLLLWVAISVAAHVLPSDHDGKHVIQAASTARDKGGSVLFIAVIPFIWILYIANALRVIWFDIILGLALVGVGVWVGGKLVAVL